jgi:hypothetical protein
VTTACQFGTTVARLSFNQGRTGSARALLPGSASTLDRFDLANQPPCDALVVGEIDGPPGKEFGPDGSL